MDKLTDLEICKRITEIELRRVFPKAKSIEFEKSQACFWVESAGFSSWRLLDPLTDDALCFKLMVKYKVWRWSNPAEGKFNACIKNVNGWVSAKTLNRAICTAIIQSKE